MQLYRNHIKNLIPYTVFILICLVVFMSFSNEVQAKNKDFQIKDGVLVKYLGQGKKVTIPDSVTQIGDYAFDGCTSLTNITIPEKVTSIGKCAFYGCNSLKDITIPSKVTALEQGTFCDCSSLKSITLPDTITKIGRSSFRDCTSLTDFKMPSAIKEIGLNAFENTPWYNAIIKENPLFIVNDILFDANQCTGVVTVPKGVTEICEDAFSNSSVTEVILQEGVTKIGYSAFSTNSLKKITLPDGLKEIDSKAFMETQIKNIDLPDTVISIGEMAFAQCKQLQSIVLPEGVSSIEYKTFTECSALEKIIIPKSVIKINPYAFFNDNMLSDIQIDLQNQKYAAEKYFLFNKNKTTLLSCAKTEGKIVVPEGIETVAEDVFYNSNAEKIIFPSTLKKLDISTINYCYELEEINLPSSMTDFEQKFQICKKLNRINVYDANGQKNFYSENGILYNADKTKLVCDLTSGKVVVSDSVTSIGPYAFPNADNITIPLTVTSINENAINIDNLWKPANVEPFCIYGYKKSEAERYCKKEGITFLAFDADYRIKYKLNGGTNNPKNPTVYNYQSDTIVLQKPTRKGYTFLYWYKDISICNDGCCRGEQKITEIPNGSMGNIELIAKWKKKRNKINK